MTAIQHPDWIIPGALANGALANGTYHFGLGADMGLISSASFFWDAAFTAGITFWTSDFPIGRVPITDVTAGRWIQQQPPSGYTAISPAGAATLGASPLIVTVPGGIAGGTNVQLGNLGARHLKAIVVVTAPGLLVYCFNGKH